MRLIKIVLPVLFLFLYYNLAEAQQRVPANPNPVVIEQPDGSKLTIIVKGDERCHWKETEDGYTILENKKGICEYAKLNRKKELVCSGVKAKDIDKRSAKEIRFLQKTAKNLPVMNKISR